MPLPPQPGPSYPSDPAPNPVRGAAFILFPAANVSNTFVTATGSTTARMLKDRFAEVIDVLDYGADPTGTADSTAAVQTAYAALGTGGTLVFPPGTFKFNLVIAKSNISIVGASRSTTAAKGGFGGTIFRANSAANPVIQVGDGTSWVRAISLRGFSVVSDAVGAAAGNDGLVFKGAEAVNAYDFDVIGFGGDNIRIESSATHPSQDLKFSQFDSSQAWGSNFKASYGATWVVDVGLSHFHMTGRNYTGAYSIYLDGVRLWVDGGYIDTGGDRQGHIYFNGTSALIGNGVAIDGSYVGGAGTDTTVESTAGSRGYPGSYLQGIITFNRSFRWGDGSKTSGGAGAGAYLPFASIGQQVSLGQLRFFPTGGPPAVDSGDSARFYRDTSADGSGNEVIKQDGGALRPLMTYLYPLQPSAGGALWRHGTSGLLRYLGSGTYWPASDGSGGALAVVSVSADRGDTSQTLTVGADASIQRWATPLTANRTVTLSTTGAADGNTFYVVRTGLGAFALDVGGLKTIPSATAAVVKVTYDGSAWVLTGYETLGADSAAIGSFGTNVGSASAPNVATNYLDDEGAYVHLAGTIVSTSGTITAGTTLCTLATAYRPNRTVLVPGFNGASGAVGYVLITSAGVLSCSFALVAGNDDLRLDAICYRKTN